MKNLEFKILEQTINYWGIALMALLILILGFISYYFKDIILAIVFLIEGLAVWIISSVIISRNRRLKTKLKSKEVKE